ncbi:MULTISPECIES: hypothetical protein [Rheinheimera]|jgi:hypothetical protein|uniref:hypothetical protein n=1 Tax=Rheinheimera TaxID=67575 RepID=UPI001E495899|nr:MULTISPECIES: hypothetical protein [Rheinheimera]|tara:strand:- start:5628 stop:5960 length:333 start_codon:yes stop_codon:yes gene_type:complete
MRLVAFLSVAFILFGFSAKSYGNDFYQIPVPTDAREFARLDNKMPAVLSFFSQQSESALRDYYIQQLGQPDMTQQHYGREQLYFTVSGNRVRILISSRDDWRQVDIMIQN